jgi:diguanylate cyclase (GGDEF)-like protein
VTRTVDLHRAVPSILIIEDSSSQRAALRSALEGLGDLTRILEAADGVVGARLLLSEAIDVVICDVELPGLAGEKLIHLAQGRDIPFLMLTAVRSAKRRAALFRLGARDVISKPVDREELLARVRLQLELARLHRELCESNARLAQLSTTDALTELPNRRHLTSTLEREWKRSVRYGTPLSVVMADVDHFKAINDRFGHPAGDAVLKAIAERLTCGLRVTDTAGRYGGEEFMLILASPADGALRAAERWRAAVETHEIALENEVRLHVTVSMGIASRSAAVTSPDELVAAADSALYAAKHAGRNRVELDPAARCGPPAAPTRGRGDARERFV